MINKEKLDFLNKYTLSKSLKVELIDISEVDESIIPEVWINIFGEADKKNRIEKLLHLWEQQVGNELRNTISYLREFLEEIEIMRIGDKISILYSVRRLKDNKILFYEGGNPLQRTFDNSNNLKGNWYKIPEKIRAFYEKIHDGFYYFPSKSMGLESSKNITYLNDYDWEVLEDLGVDLQINLETSYGFFSNGMGKYVVIDYCNCSNNNSTLWSSKNKPRYDLNFWDLVDEWIVIGFN